ncbi:saccharopine dehydrogenase family protein [Jatrophihabitans fulvus]
MATSSDREYDVVLLGGTGFAGRLTAEHLARHAPPTLRWALAGRNREKLENVRAALAAIDPRHAGLPLVGADVTDRASLQALAASTRVVASTVGPYVLYGYPLVAACAAAGTDYLDLTGEPEFVDTCYVRYHAEAERTGARLVHAAGFDSIPHDLGVFHAVGLLPPDVPVEVSGYVRANARFSGGTFASALTAMSRPKQNVTAARDRRKVEPRDDTRRARAVSGRPHRDPVQGGWALPLPTIDPQIVARSARALERYGPRFTYSHYASLPHLWTAAGAVLGVGAVAGLAQLPPARKALQKRLAPGDGPSEELRSRSWFTVTFVGTGGGKRVVTRVSGGDPGYDETAVMLAESALCLALDDLPATAGQVTTATAMGDALITRLRAAGLSFEVLEQG